MSGLRLSCFCLDCSGFREHSESFIFYYEYIFITGEDGKMPGFDGRGPFGRRGIGRGLGPCGRGGMHGRFFWSDEYGDEDFPTESEEMELIELKLERLDRRKKELEARLSELKKGSSKAKRK